MAQWKLIKDMAAQNTGVGERVTRILLQAHLPIVVRDHYADWIEQQPWYDINVESAEFAQEAEGLFKSLIVQIMQKEELQSNVVNKSQWVQDRQRMEDHFGSNSEEFVMCMRKCLSNEKMLIESCAMHQNDGDMAHKGMIPDNMAQENQAINDRLITLETNMSKLGTRVRLLSEHQDNFLIKYTDIHERRQKLSTQPGSSPSAELDKMVKQFDSEMSKMTAENYQERMTVKTLCIDVATELVLLLKNSIWQEIDLFKQQQKKMITTLDKPKNGALDILDTVCQRASQLLLKMIQSLEDVLDIYQKLCYNDDKAPCDLAKAKDELERDYLKEHVQKCFLVSKNVPKQIEKVSAGRSTDFPMQVRLLGGNGLNLSKTPKVSAHLYFEKQLKEAMHCPPDQTPPKPSANVVNGTNKTMDLGDKVRPLANFTRIKLEKVQRPDRGKNDELVTEQKYGLLFTTEIKARDNLYHLKAVSLPIILVSQTSQECMAKGTLIWDAAFSSDSRQPYDCESIAPWSKVSHLLNALFEAETGRGLTSENLHYLAMMAFREKNPNTDFASRQISEKQLIKDKMNRDSKSDAFSFWKWFWANLNLCRDRINTEWKDGIVWGFISKDDSRRKLIPQHIGTFLLRFSETSIEASQKAEFCGNITVAVVEVDPNTGNKCVVFTKDHLGPKDIQEKSLAPLLEGFEVEDYASPGKKKQLLHFLYPDTETPFEERFKKYIKIREEKLDGYVKGKLKFELFLFDRHDRRDSCVMSPPGAPMSPSSETSYPFSPTASDPGHDIDMQVLQLQAPTGRPMATIPPMQQLGAPNQYMGGLDQGMFSHQHSGQPLPSIDQIRISNFNITDQDIINTIGTLEDEDGDVILDQNLTN